MRRREFFTLGAAALLPRPGLAQSSSKVWRVGWLRSGQGGDIFLDAFKRELQGLGFIEGQNLKIELREAAGEIEKLPALAQELVKAPCDVIVAIATPAIAAAQRATQIIPIVMSPATDPIGSGFVKTLARPGGNITGIANMFPDLTGKSIQVLRELLPQAKRVGILTSANPTHPQVVEDFRVQALPFGIEMTPVAAVTPSDVPIAFAEMIGLGCEAAVIIADPLRPVIVTAARRVNLPAVYQINDYVRMGGLISYGPELVELFRRSAQLVAKIFDGASPADLPVEQPTIFKLSLNLDTARTLGLTIPPTLLARADEVIE